MAESNDFEEDSENEVPYDWRAEFSKSQELSRQFSERMRNLLKQYSLPVRLNRLPTTSEMLRGRSMVEEMMKQFQVVPPDLFKEFGISLTAERAARSKQGIEVTP